MVKSVSSLSLIPIYSGHSLKLNGEIDEFPKVRVYKFSRQKFSRKLIFANFANLNSDSISTIYLKMEHEQWRDIQLLDSWSQKLRISAKYEMAATPFSTDAIGVDTWLCELCLVGDRPHRGRNIGLIQQFARENYDISYPVYPSALCGGGTLPLYKKEKDDVR